MSYIFRHRSPAPTAGNYKAFRAYIREDFHECCAYCLMHELSRGGPQQFDLDHRLPKVDFQHLKSTYTNIYYSCHACNLLKGQLWSTQKMVDVGARFVDSCEELFSDHFSAEAGGYWQPLTEPGRYTADLLRLNSPFLQQARVFLADFFALAGHDPINWDLPLKKQIATVQRHAHNQVLAIQQGQQENSD